MIKELSIYKHMLVLTGLAFVFAAYLWYLNISLTIDSFDFTRGTVVDLEYSVLGLSDIPNAVVHFYTSAGEWVELILQDPDVNIGLAEGESVDLMYPVLHPRAAIIYDNFDLWGGPVFVLSIGAGLLLLGLSFAVNSLMEKRQIQECNSKTTQLQTMFINVEKNRGAEVDGNLPYCIYSQWRNPKTSEIYFFQSENLWADPSEYIKGKKITVHVEQDDLSEYSVDLSFLPRRIVNNRPGLSK
jgi:hypothetical protein